MLSLGTNYVTVLFSTSPGVFGSVIRTACWSRWSHVGLVHGDEFVIEALAGVGVRRAPLAGVVKGYSDYEFCQFPCKSPDKILAAAASQIGKPYDYTGVVGIGVRRDWQNTDSWFCSELVAWAFNVAGDPLFRPEALDHVTPQHLWMVSPAPIKKKVA